MILDVYSWDAQPVVLTKEEILDQKYMQNDTDDTIFGLGSYRLHTFNREVS